MQTFYEGVYACSSAMSVALGNQYMGRYVGVVSIIRATSLRVVITPGTPDNYARQLQPLTHIQGNCEFYSKCQPHSQNSAKKWQRLDETLAENPSRKQLILFRASAADLNR